MSRNLWAASRITLALDTDLRSHGCVASARSRTPDPDHPDRWFVMDGRRWRRTDPALPQDLVDRLTSHLGRGRSGIGAAKRAGDDAAIAAARRRVDLAKHGLGERGPHWWDDPEEARLGRAREALTELDRLAQDDDQ